MPLKTAATEFRSWDGALRLCAQGRFALYRASKHVSDMGAGSGLYKAEQIFRPDHDPKRRKSKQTKFAASPLH